MITKIKMMQRKVLIPLIVLAIVVGGFFYAWYVWIPAQIAKETKSSSQPTKWSSYKNYLIERKIDGTLLVVNKEAGVNFNIPKGWKVEKNGNGKEWWLNIYSSDARMNADKFLIAGCKIMVEVEYQKDEANFVKHDIQQIETKGKSTKNETGKIVEEKKVIKVSNHKGVQTSIKAKEPKIAKKMGLLIKVEIPINSNELTRIEFNSHEDKCNQEFKEFLKNLAIK